METIIFQVDSSEESKVSNGRWYGANQLLSLQIQNAYSSIGWAACDTKPSAEVNRIVPGGHDIKRIMSYSTLKIKQSNSI
ncbi:leucine-rich repeat receptor-like serine/threonine-protein kinase [Corchorus olitorius]|uniref:Leucine-rich repeat receptor-like serine/threonine-protein kinase n=1 Tax=Corchorus olitorius TaxID=93759 RepID=A0A1R3JRF7_9ROSI|nr:leucine-rich repeat receptor-like serine/threonine-protein kinase [Corchorus olitorius]